MELVKQAYYNPFFAVVNRNPYELQNIIIFDKKGVICSTRRGWFSGGDNDFKNGLTLPGECVLKRKVDFSLDSPFIIKHQDGDDKIFGRRYNLYIPAAVIGLQKPTAERFNSTKREFTITYRTDFKGVFINHLHFVDGDLSKIEQQIIEIGKEIHYGYKFTTDYLQSIIKKLQELQEEYDKEYKKMLAITPEEVLQNYKRSDKI